MDTVQVVDLANQPVPDVAITVTNVRTGQVYEMARSGFEAEGRYPVFNNGISDDISMIRERILVQGRKDAMSFEQMYVYRTNICRCGYERVSGPDVIVIK